MSEPLSFFGKSKLDVLFLLCHILDMLTEISENDLDTVKEELSAYETEFGDDLLDHYKELAEKRLSKDAGPVERIKETALAVIPYTEDDVRRLREDLANANKTLSELRTLAGRADIALSKRKNKDIRTLARKIKELAADQEAYIDQLEKESPDKTELIAMKYADLGLLRMFQRLLLM